MRSARQSHLKKTHKSKASNPLQLLLFDSNGNVESQVEEKGTESCANNSSCRLSHSVIRHAGAETILCQNSPVESSEDKCNMTLPDRKPKPTYSQNWRSYNQAQKNEKGMFLSLLFELCEGIYESPQARGRKRASLRDVIFCIVLKNYTMLSGRRNDYEVEEAHAKGYIEKPLRHNTVFKYMLDEEISVLLRDMINTSAMALNEIETDIAFDSTGYGTPNFKRWYDMKYGNTEDWHDWFKLHIACGVKTGIITSFEISERHAHDSRFFKKLYDSTTENGFVIERAFADKGYITKANLRLVVNNDAKAYIPFKSNAKFSSSNTVWNKLLHYFLAYQDEFYEFYHLRSNVESVFSAQKRKFGNRLTSRHRTAQINEIMAKVLAYNICVVARSLQDLEIEPTFKLSATNDKPNEYSACN
jgi:transposase